MIQAAKKRSFSRDVLDLQTVFTMERWLRMLMGMTLREHVSIALASCIPAFACEVVAALRECPLEPWDPP